jgi:hypothetical protein
MPRFRLVVVGLMSVLVLMGVAASSASAEVKFELLVEPCTKGSFVAFCWAESEGAELLELSGEEEFSALLDNGPAAFSASPLGIVTTCTAGENVLSVSRVVQRSPLAEDYRIGKVELLFSGCTVTGQKCTVREPIMFTEIEGTPENLELALSETWLRLKPEAAKKEVFTEFTLEGAECPETIVGKNPAKGEVWCEWLEILVDLPSHLLDCEQSESKLTFGKSMATFQAGFEVEPDNAGTDLWDIEEEA